MSEKCIFQNIAALLLFGFNGIVASYILKGQQNNLFLRSLIGGIFPHSILALSKQSFGKKSRFCI